MASMSDLRNYKATEKSLSDRLDLMRTKEAARHSDWQALYTEQGEYVDPNMTHEVADKKLAAWTLAIDRANQTDMALGFIRAIIKEMEGN